MNVSSLKVILVGAACIASSACLSEQRPPFSTQVLNLGSQEVVNFTVEGYPFQSVMLLRRPGEALTPHFGGGSLEYEIYWSLSDGSMHGASIDLRDLLPDHFRGQVVISIHDHGWGLTWARANPNWLPTDGSPSRPPPSHEPMFVDCAGPLLTHDLTKEAWRIEAGRFAERFPRQEDKNRIFVQDRCTLDWYIPHSDRQVGWPNEESLKIETQRWAERIEQHRRSGTPDATRVLE
jgi:hypothetical protein